MVLGSIKELKAHAEMMCKMPEIERADENMVLVEPGKSGELIWNFSKAGKFDFARLEPGHFEAGIVANTLGSGPLWRVVTAEFRTAKPSDKGVEMKNTFKLLLVLATTVTIPLASFAADGMNPFKESIDKDAGKMMIEHGALANLDMAGMTTVFRAKDAAMLDQVKMGDQVKFNVEKLNSAMTESALEAVK